MYKSSVEAFANLAKEKSNLLRNNFFGYFVSSMLAGIYVGFGIVLIFAIGSPLFSNNSPFLKFIMGISFGIALTLVIFAGSELYTGNTMVMSYGVFLKTVRLRELLLVWLISYFGNLAGSLLISYLVYISGGAEQMIPILSKIVPLKMQLSVLALIIRGFLCNLLVCLAVWMSGRAKDDTAKIFLIFWCLFAFIGSGFEHSIANMSLISLGIFQLNLGWMGFLYNLLWVTIGNTLAGVMLAFSYYLISK
jgi:nitrite transporter NirC